ncbi:MAG TPA: hypothetical protein VKF32_10140 [Thermoanaerobaculia bacterium]|nr:hypothetical protein [Thermoanaerobaculia bacterium]
MNNQVVLIVVAAIAVLAIAGLAYVLLARRRREHLHKRFGPEYEHEVAAVGNAKKAEARLEEREKRVEKLRIRPVPPEMADRFARSWQQVQARFVDEPGAAVSEADALVRKVMETRGYPVGTFEQNAADISVDHPLVVSNYRAAHEIALKRDRGEASTEELRQAFVHYRALFSELIEVRVPEPVEVHRG